MGRPATPGALAACPGEACERVASPASSARGVGSLAASREAGLLALDVEFGNAHGFFSAARAVPDLYSAERGDGVRSYRAEIEGVRLLVTDRVATVGGAISRELVFEALAASRLFDLVSRCVVIDASGMRSASIDGVEVAHRSSNLYHQHPAGTVRVPIGTAAWLELRGEAEGMPPGFEQVFYVRDERRVERGNRWIVHHRIVATLAAQRLVLRGCNPRFEGPAPRWLDARVPAWLKHRLFRVRERRFPNFPVMVIGENAIRAGTRIALRTRIEHHA